MRADCRTWGHWQRCLSAQEWNVAESGSAGWPGLAGRIGKIASFFHFFAHPPSHFFLPFFFPFHVLPAVPVPSAFLPPLWPHLQHKFSTFPRSRRFTRSVHVNGPLAPAVTVPAVVKASRAAWREVQRARRLQKLAKRLGPVGWGTACRKDILTRLAALTTSKLRFMKAPSVRFATHFKAPITLYSTYLTERSARANSHWRFWKRSVSTRVETQKTKVSRLSSFFQLLHPFSTVELEEGGTAAGE